MSVQELSNKLESSVNRLSTALNRLDKIIDIRLKELEEIKKLGLLTCENLKENSVILQKLTEKLLEKLSENNDSNE